MAMLRLPVIAIIVSMISSSVNGAGFLRFVKPENAEDFGIPFYSSNGDTGPVTWYASWPNDFKYVVAGYSQEFPLKNLYCTVEPVTDKYTIQQARVCFKTEGKDNCKKIEAVRPELKGMIAVDSAGKLQAEVSFSIYNGITIKMPKTPPDTPVTSQFYCSLSNIKGTIQSNNLILVDYRSQWIKKAIYLPSIPKLQMSKPVVIDCATMNVPKKYAQYRWGTCNTVKISHCIPNVFGPTPSWPMQVLSNGSLYIPYFTPESKARLSNRYIGCMLGSGLIRMFNKYTIKIENDPPGYRPVQGVKIISPKTNKVELVQQSTQSLTCEFTIGPGKFTKEWIKVVDGKKVVLKSANIAEIKATINDNQNLMFDGLMGFSKSTPGKYLCEITYSPSLGGPTITETAEYDVTVMYYPEIAKNIVPMVFVMDGYNATTPCGFIELYGPADGDTIVTPSLALNGVKLNLASAGDLTTSVGVVNNKFAKYMSHLEVTVSPLAPKPGDTLTYLAKNMYYRNPIDKKSTSHAVTCIGTNKAGTTRKNVVMMVVPKLVMSSTPSQTNCSECSAKEEHVFKCVIENMGDYNKSGSNVVITKNWKLGDNIILKSSKVYVISEDNSTFTIPKIEDKNVKDDINKHGVITCYIVIEYPAGMTAPPGLPKGPNGQGVFYIANTDARISHKLSTSIQIRDIAPKPAAANMSWVIALTLSIVVVIIIVVIVFAWCRRRAPGETYDVDHTEKKQGNDPETEHHEKEAFPVYERPEDGPIRGSRASLDDSIHVGSDDEDEDLAEYDVDIGKFNEEGSFIGQYAVNDGHNTGRKLPNVSHHE